MTAASRVTYEEGHRLDELDREVVVDGTGLGATETFDCRDGMTRVINGAMPSATAISFTNFPTGPIFTIEFTAAQTNLPTFPGTNTFGSRPTHTGRVLYEVNKTAGGIQITGMDVGSW